MKEWAQNDNRWASKQLGDCLGTTIGGYGCYCTSLAMLADIRPDEANDILKNGGYAQGCLIVDVNASKVLGIEYNGITYNDPKDVCIAETNDYAGQGVPQHFFVWLGNGEIIDPLIGSRSTNHYNVKSFRLFKPKEEGSEMKKEDVARALAIERTAQPLENEKNYIISDFIDKGKDLEDYARNNCIRDGHIPLLWRATTGEKSCPKSEIDFWDIYFREHSDKELGDLAGTWYDDHVKKPYEEMKTKMQKEIDKSEKKYTDYKNTHQTTDQAVGDMKTEIEEMEKQLKNVEDYHNVDTNKLINELFNRVGKWIQSILEKLKK